MCLTPYDLPALCNQTQFTDVHLQSSRTVFSHKRLYSPLSSL